MNGQGLRCGCRAIFIVRSMTLRMRKIGHLTARSSRCFALCCCRVLRVMVDVNSAVADLGAKSHNGGARLLRLPAVCERTGLKKTQLYELMKTKSFPSSIKLGARTTVWSAETVDAWIDDRIVAATTPRGA